MTRAPYLIAAAGLGVAAWWFYNDPRAIWGLWVVCAGLGVGFVGLAVRR